MDNLRTLLDQFVFSTVRNYEARLSGNSTLANKHYKMADQCICEIKQDTDWVSIFVPLLHHEHISVRIRVASILLPHETKQAERTLRKCMFHSGEEGFIARMVLTQWKSGELKLPEYHEGQVCYK